MEAKEAHEMGLANRLVPAGSAYGHAMNMARELARFPQECLRADRRSAYHATFASRSLEESLQFEIENGLNVISKVSCCLRVTKNSHVNALPCRLIKSLNAHV